MLLFLNLITLDDIINQCDTRVAFFWLAVLIAISAQLNELGFVGVAASGYSTRRHLYPLAA